MYIPDSTPHDIVNKSRTYIQRLLLDSLGYISKYWFSCIVASGGGSLRVGLLLSLHLVSLQHRHCLFHLALQTGWVLKHVEKLGVVDLQQHPGDLSS